MILNLKILTHETAVYNELINGLYVTVMHAILQQHVPQSSSGKTKHQT